MTDRHAGYVVTLAADIREDQAEEILTALRMVKGVLAVEPVVADALAESIARRRERSRMRGMLGELYQRLDEA